MLINLNSRTQLNSTTSLKRESGFTRGKKHKLIYISPILK